MAAPSASPIEAEAVAVGHVLEAGVSDTGAQPDDARAYAYAHATVDGHRHADIHGHRDAYLHVHIPGIAATDLVRSWLSSYFFLVSAWVVLTELYARRNYG